MRKMCMRGVMVVLRGIRVAVVVVVVENNRKNATANVTTKSDITLLQWL